jgi:capsular polysaccharide biosynthesis protein
MFGTGPNLQRGLEVEIGDVTVSRLAIEWLRKRLAPTEPCKARIYIDRRAVMAPVRLLNGDDVERTFADFGFETVHPAEMSFAEQRAVFGNAAYIAGETGAAMTNVLLAPSSTVMICMQARRWPLSIYADLCTYGGQRNLFFVGEPATGEVDGTDGRTYQSGFRMGGDLLRNRLREILGG